MQNAMNWIVSPQKLINSLSYLNHSWNLKPSDDNEKIMTANIIECLNECLNHLLF